MQQNTDIPVESIDPPEFHLASLNRQIRELMDFTLRPHGLKLVEFRLLQCLAERPALTICDLSDLAVIERTVTSRMVDKLAERKLVVKSVMANDRRFSQVSLTASGRRLLKATNADVTSARALLFANLGQDRIAMLLDTLQQMQANAHGAMRSHPSRRPGSVT